ncbi:hypothetical protein B0H94_1234 [Salsuginibacillus halophilus]|uniref:Uncharacterized protein n=1 Tax=Salsuginibacillus halophilus TaxID=517424 RepID=A0A2P8H3M2_9BACI|nr:hypothetical protein B0H94_1234 [Salsuginibacillus halophilus]
MSLDLKISFTMLQLGLGTCDSSQCWRCALHFCGSEVHFPGSALHRWVCGNRPGAGFLPYQGWEDVKSRRRPTFFHFEMWELHFYAGPLHFRRYALHRAWICSILAGASPFFGERGPPVGVWKPAGAGFLPYEDWENVKSRRRPAFFHFEVWELHFRAGPLHFRGSELHRA